MKDRHFKSRLFRLLQKKKKLKAKIVVADPDSLEAKEDLAYGYPTFFSDLEESISILRRYKRIAQLRALQDRLEIGKSNKVKRETLLISDLSDDRKHGRISLRYTLLGTRPEDRPEIVIDSQRHPKRFRELIRNYWRLIKYPVTPL